MTETLRGYDAWLTTEPEPSPIGDCSICGDHLYDEDDLWEAETEKNYADGHGECVLAAVRQWVSVATLADLECGVSVNKCCPSKYWDLDAS